MQDEVPRILEIILLAFLWCISNLLNAWTSERQEFPKRVKMENLDQYQGDLGIRPSCIEDVVL